MAEPTPSEATNEPSVPQEQESPEGVLALQYEYINAGNFEGAYSLFASQSQQEISLEQYRAFFEANAPYSVTDYLFPSMQAQGDSATVDAAFTVTSAAGVERLRRTQQLVRENGDWRVVMRPEQITAFTAADNSSSVESIPEPEPVPAPKSARTPKSASEPKESSTPAPVTTSDSWPSGAPIKGNVSSSGEFIYHIPGGQCYDRTKPERCFANESDAQNAGVRKSQR